jgi:proline iminopeptidase
MATPGRRNGCAIRVGSSGTGLAFRTIMRPRDAAITWVRRARDPLAELVRRAATSALGTYGAYVGYGLLRPELRTPLRGGEADEPLAGDGLVAEPQAIKTFAVDVAAPPDAVWPWLVQMGYGRAGWYGWYPLENGGRGSADGVLPGLQALARGDLIPDGPRADEGRGVWRVIELVPREMLVLFSRRVATTGEELDADAPITAPTIECSWAFIVRPTKTGSRLIVRVRARFLGADDGVLARLARHVFDLGDTVMEWTMVDGIRARAERAAATSGRPA